MTATSARRIVEALLENVHATELSIFIADRREAGETWPQIAAGLREFTNGVVDVSWMTVRRWAGDLGVAA